MVNILDVGCGDRKISKTAVGIDFVKVKGVDVVHNLNKFPYPFSDNSFDVVYAGQVLEHLDADLDKILFEFCRICKKDGIIKVVVPHALNVAAFADPSHKKFFTYFTFDYFGENAQSYYSKARVRVVRRKFRYMTGKVSSVILKPLEFLINLIPRFYSHFLAFIIPCSHLYFELKPIKN